MKLISAVTRNALLSYFLLPGLLTLLFIPPARAQEDTTAQHSLHPVFSLDSRSTIIQGRNITINGLLAGVSFGEKHHKVTVGYYWLNYNAKQRLINLHKKLSESINLSSYTKTDVYFISFAYWYPIYIRKKWTVSAPLELGLGKETANYRRLFDDNPEGRNNFLFSPYQAGLYGEYHATPWIGLFTQIGYRNAFSDTEFRKRFQGMYYSYGITIYPDAIFKLFKHPH